MDLLNNPWVIGIGGGILSGLFVAWITRLIFSRRDNKEYLQKLKAANQEVLYAIRPGISEEVIPNPDVVAHLTAATSRRYDVDAELMYSVNEIASELIKEVMDSSFISAATKQSFCEKLSKLIPATPTTVKDRVSELRAAGKSKNQTARIMAMMAGLMTGMAAATIASKDILSLRDPDTVFLLLVPALIAVLVSLVWVFMREMQNSKLAKFTFNIAGIRAEFEPKIKNETDSRHNK